LREDDEFRFVRGVELSLEELFWLTEELSLWNHKLLLTLNVIDGDTEVWHTSNHEKIFTASRECHTDALDCGVHLERVLFLWLTTALVAEDMNLWIKAIFGACD